MEENRNNNNNAPIFPRISDDRKKSSTALRLFCTLHIFFNPKSHDNLYFALSYNYIISLKHTKKCLFMKISKKNCWKCSQMGWASFQCPLSEWRESMANQKDCSSPTLRFRKCGRSGVDVGAWLSGGSRFCKGVIFDRKYISFGERIATVLLDSFDRYLLAFEIRGCSHKRVRNM